MVDVLDRTDVLVLMATPERDARKITVWDHVSPKLKTTCVATNSLASSALDHLAAPLLVLPGVFPVSVVQPNVTVPVGCTATLKRNCALISTSVAVFLTSVQWEPA